MNLYIARLCRHRASFGERLVLLIMLCPRYEGGMKESFIESIHRKESYRTKINQ